MEPKVKTLAGQQGQDKEGEPDEERRGVSNNSDSDSSEDPREIIKGRSRLSRKKRRKKQPVISSSDDEPIYNAERIIAVRVKVNKGKGELEYLIKWEGFPPSETTWETTASNGGTLQDSWIKEQGSTPTLDDLVESLKDVKLAVSENQKATPCRAFLTKWTGVPGPLSTWEHTLDMGGILSPDTISRDGPFPSTKQLYQEADPKRLQGMIDNVPLSICQPSTITLICINT